MPEYAELISRGGNARVAFGLRIEGLDDVFVSDISRSQFGEFGWTPGTDHVSKQGLDAAAGLTIEERADWRGAKLSAAGLNLVIRDMDASNRATRAFGGRVPSLRTFLAADLSDTETTALVVHSTAGWPSSGIVHIGREAIAYDEITNATTFGTLTRGHLGTLACAHPKLSGSIEVTDTPAAIERRRAQLYLFVDNAASADADVIWRGVVESTRGVANGYEIALGHNSVLLDQEFGENVQPFGIRGFYFHGLDRLYVRVGELPDPFSFGDDYAYVNSAEITGFYETLEDVAAAVTALLRDPDEWVKTSDGSTGALPVNEEYTCVVRDGSLAITFRTDATTPRGAWIDRGHRFFSGERDGRRFGDFVLEAPDGRIHRGVGSTYALGASHVFTIRAEHPAPAPAAYVQVGGGMAGRLLAEPDYPGNRIYYSSGAPTTITHFWPYESEGDARDVIFRVVSVNTTDGYFEVNASLPAFGKQFIDDGSGSVKFDPIADYGTVPWHGMLRALVEATPTATRNSSPWLPEDEFDLDDIDRESAAAGADAFIGDWKITSATSLRKLFEPHLLMLGLCWTSGYDGRITVRAIQVASDSANAEGDYTDRDGDHAADVTTESARDGIVNVCRVSSGYDPRTKEYARTGSGAIDENSMDAYDQVALDIEPINGELTDASRDYVLRDALAGARIVATHAYPYTHATLTGIPGLKLARLLVGDTITVTDKRIPWLGVRGCENVRGQVVNKRVRWFGDGSPGVDLVVRLSDWSAAGYAPAARIVTGSLTSSGGTNNAFLYRAENWYSDAPRTGTRYDGAWFQATNVVRVRKLDASTAVEAGEVTIVSIDTATRTVVTDTNLGSLGINTAGTIWVLEYDGREFVPGPDDDTASPKQTDYAFIANEDHEIPPTGDAARVYAA